ncbi:hypothetical protein PR048_022504 [Dryococelus australis]|uniref:Ionotropic glutamate receptor L-glutamate and glycine-binding domain-containing protein n=1 Tax=Dryococelus australis TaxID=614101 RepID=A0ABQ9H161_9NEOP|nr:hypothetical protein PR048_022504 [Dryococelus australis]
MKGPRKREIPEKTSQPEASFDTTLICEKLGVARPGIGPGSPWWEANRLTAQPLRPPVFVTQVELEGLTGEVRFSEDGRRQNYTLHVVEMTVNSAMVKVAEWTDEAGFLPVAAKYVRLKPHHDIEKNKTYIVTTIVVSVTVAAKQKHQLSHCWEKISREITGRHETVSDFGSFLFLPTSRGAIGWCSASSLRCGRFWVLILGKAWTTRLPPRRTGLDSQPGHSPGFSHVGILPDDAAGRRVFSEISRFPNPFISALPHSNLDSPSSPLKTSILKNSVSDDCRRLLRERTLFLLQEEPYIMMRTPEPKENLTGNDRFEGYCKDLADLIAHRLGINCECPCILASTQYGSQ